MPGRGGTGEAHFFKTQNNRPRHAFLHLQEWEGRWPRAGTEESVSLQHPQPSSDNPFIIPPQKPQLLLQTQHRREQPRDFSCWLLSYQSICNQGILTLLSIMYGQPLMVFAQMLSFPYPTEKPIGHGVPLDQIQSIRNYSISLK